MAVALRQSRSFDSASPVTRYWLANCVGFSLTGGDRGVVEGVLADHDLHEPAVLVVRSGRHRVKRLSTSSVVAVVPSDRLLVVEKKESTAAVRARIAGRVAGRGSVLFARLLALLASHGWRLTCRGCAFAWPHAVRLTREGGTHTVRLVRSVPWQRFARSALSGTTKQPPDRSESS